MSARRSWLLTLLLTVFVLGLGFSWGFMARARGWFPAAHLRGLASSSLGLRLQGVAPSEANGGLTDWQRLNAIRERLGSDDERGDGAALKALGYASGYERAPGMSGVVFHASEAARPGLNLVVSGHGLEVGLLSMAGEPVHTWRLDGLPELPPKADTELPAMDASWDCHESGFFRRARLRSDGVLLAILNCGGVVALAPDSTVLWSAEPSAHHELDFDDRDNAWVLTRRARVNTSIHGWRPILEDEITRLDQNGQRQHSFSVLAAIQRSDWGPVLGRADGYGDILHTNSIEWLNGRHEQRNAAFARGNLLISLRQLDFVAVVDPRSETVVWGMSGLFQAQHEPSLLESGHLLVFDNRGGNGFSRVLELDPATARIVWSYDGSEANGFYSDTSGSAQRLDNGNTLITESNGGRAFEVDPRGRIVWEFFNPARSGADDELIATLFDLVRLEASVLESLGSRASALESSVLGPGTVGTALEAGKAAAQGYRQPESRIDQRGHEAI